VYSEFEKQLPCSVCSCLDLRKLHPSVDASHILHLLPVAHFFMKWVNHSFIKANKFVKVINGLRVLGQFFITVSQADHFNADKDHFCWCSPLFLMYNHPHNSIDHQTHMPVA